MSYLTCFVWFILRTTVAGTPKNSDLTHSYQISNQLTALVVEKSSKFLFSQMLFKYPLYN